MTRRMFVSRTAVSRTAVSALIAVAALTLGACGGTAGTTETSPAGGQSSTAAAPENSESSESTEAAVESSSAPAEGSGTLDAQSSAWFNAACTGLTPMGDMLASVLGVGMQIAMATDTASPDAPKPADLQKKLVDALDTAGKSLTDTQATLAALPAPTIAKGAEIAAAFGKFLQTAGPQLTEVAKQVAAAPATDTASLSAALAKIQTLGSQEMQGADVLDSVDPATKTAIEALPACKAMQDALGGLIGGGSSDGATASTEG